MAGFRDTTGWVLYFQKKLLKKLSHSQENIPSKQPPVQIFTAANLVLKH